MPKLYIVALLMGLPMAGQELKVDHATAAGRDLRSMMLALQAVGIPSQYGGPHANRATEMALTSFPDGSYLELIAIQRRADPAAVAAHEWHIAMESNSGPCAWAVRPMNLPSEIQRLREASIVVTDAKETDAYVPIKSTWNGRRRRSAQGTALSFHS